MARLVIQAVSVLSLLSPRLIVWNLLIIDWLISSKVKSPSGPITTIWFFVASARFLMSCFFPSLQWANNLSLGSSLRTIKSLNASSLWILGSQ